MADEDEDDDGSDVEGLTRLQILEHATEILEEFQSDGVPTMGVRQIYYQFVGRGLLVQPTGMNANGDEPNKWWNRQYKRIGNVLSEARYDGDFSITGIVDEGREVHHGGFTRTVREDDIDQYVNEARAIRKAIPDFLGKRDMWHGQPVHLSVWVEKQGLEGIFDQVCSPKGVGLFACKGYPSVSALYDWLRHAYFAVHGEHPDEEHRLGGDRSYTFGHGFDWTERHEGTAEECVVLYFGDHDPDGFEIPRSAERGLQRLMDGYGLAVPLRFERVALNIDQIWLHNPPPFPAKKSSARYKRYRNEHGIDDAWELDALNPKALQTLLRDNIARFFDRGIHQTNVSEVYRLRAELRRAIGLDDGDSDDGDDNDPDGSEE